MSELGLFPLPIVLLPTERVPLHIFEPRYRELIDECLETGSEFGLIFATEEGAVHEIGTRATVEEVLDQLDDGRLDIVVEGRERFKLLELTSGRSFTTGIVEALVDDEDEPLDPPDVKRAIEVFASLVAETRESRRRARARLRRSSTSSSRLVSTSHPTRSRNCSRRRRRASGWSA